AALGPVALLLVKAVRAHGEGWSAATLVATGLNAPAPGEAAVSTGRVAVERAVVVLLLAGTGALLVTEGLENRQAVVWAALQPLIALPYAATWWAARRRGLAVPA
ncbi:MAG TPA: hypothetical protein VEH84_03085, partial [Alphaproteobacteria bacterium]|nr:hypothetical protein [Alphaproteobacteria bacterium]